MAMSLMGGFVDPQNGDVVQLNAFLNARNYHDFEPSAHNIVSILPPKTMGTIKEVKHFASGNYGLYIDVKKGGKDQKVWIYYNPHASSISLCKNKTGACEPTQEVAQAPRAETLRPVPAYRAPAVRPKAPVQTQAPAAATGPVHISDVAKISEQMTSLSVATADGTVNCANTAMSTSYEEPTPSQDLSCIPVGNAYAKPRIGGTNREQEFINYMAPIAIAVQEQTGWPASVVIAQASLETNWAENGYGNRNSLFGLSCGHPGETLTYNLILGNQTQVTTTGRCTWKRPANEGGYYVVFDNPIDSVYAYIFTSMQSKRVAYFSTGKYLSTPPDGHSSITYQEAIQELSHYATDTDYRAKLLSRVTHYHLDRFDHMGLCQ
jgi:flagellum-specific peptidoglycan hydrolase FlgJ